MNSTLKGVLSLAGRTAISLIFLMSAVGNKIPKFSDVATYMGQEGVPAPTLLLVGAIAFLIVGSLSVIVGYQTRVGASLLLVFLIAATYYFHDFWMFDGPERQQQMIQFMKNLSLAGTMLTLIANGPGGFSVDERNTTTRPTGA